MIYLDYTGRLTPEQLKAAGVTGVCRYLSWMPNPKVILKPEYDTLIAGGIDVILNWEFDTYDWLGGYDSGIAHGREAVRQAKELGYPLGKPIPGSCDFNISAAQWASSGRAYGEVYSQVIAEAGYLPGIYGPFNALTWAQRDLPAFRWFWQAGMSWAWDNNNQDWPGANLIQRHHLTVAGQDTDLSTVEKGWNLMPNPYIAGTPSSDQEMADWWNYFFRNKLAFGGVPEIEAFLPKLLRETHDAAVTAATNTQNLTVNVTLAASDKQEIIDGVAAKVTNDLADAVFTRFKDQMEK